MNNELKLSGVLQELDSLTSDLRIYRISKLGEEPFVDVVRFVGLLPEEFSSRSDDDLSSWISALRSALPMPSYLGPFRDEPAAIFRTPGVFIKSLGERGQRALELLLDDTIRHKGGLLRQTSEWFSLNFDGQQLKLDTSSLISQALITSRYETLSVPLSKTGAGFAQVLPIVVQNFAIRIKRLPALMLIVEQPELHLHPAAHGAVADLFLETTLPPLLDQSPICMIETHSEQLVMRVRRRIAEGADHRNFQILSFDHCDLIGEVTTPLRSINFDKNGDPDAWPAGVFEESFDDLTKLRQAARA